MPYYHLVSNEADITQTNIMSTLKIDWNKDSKSNARIEISDGVVTHYVSEDQLPEEFRMAEIAEAFTRGYDHGDTSDTYAVGWIKDLDDEETHDFAFDGHGNFEWDTDRQG